MISTFFSAVICLAQLLLCFIAHECGHVLVARFHHVEIKKIGMCWTGAYVRRARTTGWPEISICLAGAAVNLALAIAFIHADPWFALCNFTFAWVNLLPIANSDGTHALEAWRDLRGARIVDRVGNVEGVR